jgi:carboxymethylenebutenolidase
MIMQNQTITLQVEGANDMIAYAASPDDKGPHAAIIVLQEAFGVNHHMKSILERIAAEGYVAIAPELFHRTAPPGFVAAYSDFEAVRPHMSTLTKDALVCDLQATYQWLQENKQVISSKIASIGFCLGGRVSFIANATLPLSAAVSYYGGYMNTVADKAKDLNGPQLLIWGGMDKHILPEHREAVTSALNAAGKPYINILFSTADHGFNCDERASYNADASKEAWAITLSFFRNNLAF